MKDIMCRYAFLQEMLILSFWGAIYIPFLSDCPSLILGIAIHCIQHSQAMLERGVCELAHSFFHIHWRSNPFGLLRLPNVDYWLTAGVTGQHGMLTHPRHLIPSLVYPGDRVCYVLIFVLFLEYEIDYDFSCSTSLFYGKMVNLLARVYYFNYFASVYSFFPTQLMSFIHA